MGCGPHGQIWDFILDPDRKNIHRVQPYLRVAFFYAEAYSI